MHQDGFIFQAVTMLGYHLPDLLASATALALLWGWTSAAPGRALALAGAAMVLASSLLRAAASVGQSWIIYNNDGSYDSISAMITMFSAVGVLLSLVWAAGLVMLALGACQAMRARAEQPVRPPVDAR